MTDAPVNPLRSALFTDLYELTMAQAYLDEGLCAPAAFELFFRKLPDCRNYVLAAGLGDVLDYLEHLRFTDDDLDYLRRQELFDDALLAQLKSLRFTGDVDAVPEGTIVFPNEPLVRVVAPMIESQIVETLVLNQVHFQSVVASKAARVVTAAASRIVVDFGSRRAHGTDAALKVARASYLAGAVGTSNVLAGKVYDMPIFGTMAHSFVQVHDHEIDAFAAFAERYPETTLLVDTWDTLDGVRNVIRLSRRLGERFRVQAIRLDSGDMGELARQSRALLDEAGLTEVKIFASGGLDEYEVERLVASGAPTDAFGVGTRMVVSRDAPDLDMAYKLVEYAGTGRRKTSEGKESYPGRKQVFRTIDSGVMVGDVIALADEQLPGQPLLVPVMRGGKRLPAGNATLEQARETARRQIEALPPELRALPRAAAPYRVDISPALRRAAESIAGG